jgi:hypothetical protein
MMRDRDSPCGVLKPDRDFIAATILFRSLELMLSLLKATSRGNSKAAMSSNGYQIVRDDSAEGRL